MLTLPQGITGKSFAKKPRNSRSFFEQHIRDQITHRLDPSKLPKRHAKPGFKIIPETPSTPEYFTFSAYYRNKRVKLDGTNEVFQGPVPKLNEFLDSVLKEVVAGNYDSQLADILAQNPVPKHKPKPKPTTKKTKNP